MNLGVQVSRSGDMSVVVLSGELDISEVAVANEGIRQAEEGAASTVALDLRGLTFMDSSGLRLVLAADARARAEGRTLLVVRGPRAVQRVFDVSMVEERLNLVDELPASDGEPDV